MRFSSRIQRPRVFVLTALLLSAVVVALYRCGWSVAAVKAVLRAPRAAQISDRDQRPDRPIVLERRGPIGLPVGIGEREIYSEAIGSSTQTPDGVSYLLHVLRFHGRDGWLYDAKLGRREAILSVLTDEQAARRYFGTPLIVRTRTGASFLGTGATAALQELAQEAHRDQCLAAFAEAGVPLSYPILASGQRGELREVLADSIANFQLKQSELEWTAIAYALYQPDHANWQNKLGESFSFDTVVAELMARDLDGQSCAGTHVLYALTVIERVDREHVRCLSDASRMAVRGRLSQLTAATLATQAADGGWDSGWARPDAQAAAPVSPGESLLTERLLITGHVAEWLLLLAPRTAEVDAAILRAGTWLHARLNEMSAETAREVICPYTHAACVVLALSPRLKTGQEQFAAGAPATRHELISNGKQHSQ